MMFGTIVGRVHATIPMHGARAMDGRFGDDHAAQVTRRL